MDLSQNVSQGMLECRMNADEFFVYMELIGVKGVLQFHELISTLYGPILWTICGLGIILNLCVIFPQFISTISVTSIFTGSISITLILKSIMLVFEWDLYQGKIATFYSYYLNKIEIKNTTFLPRE